MDIGLSVVLSESLYLVWILLKQKSTEVVDRDMESIGVGMVGGWRQRWGGVGDAICGSRSGLKGFFLWIVDSVILGILGPLWLQVKQFRL